MPDFSTPVIYSDTLTRRLYANDASMYEELPRGVCFPSSAEELRLLVKKVKTEQISITARAAGTSLAGQTTGNGIIADISRTMDEILWIDPELRQAKVEPGVIRDALNREAAKHGLIFGPDTSTTNRCMIGGMIGNNSAGSFSIKYGSTREHVISIEAVLSDGSFAVFEPLDEEQLQEKLSENTLEGSIYREMVNLLYEYKQKIEDTFPHPDVKRRNTGYALDKLCEMHPITPGGRPFNLCELLCGSEGTLALTVAAVLNLEKIQPYKTLVIPHFQTLDEAMRATVLAVSHNPSAVELIDRTVLDATKGNLEQERNRFFLNDEPACILIIEFDGDSEQEINDKAKKLVLELKSNGFGYAFPHFSDANDMKRVWELRKAGLGLLMGLSDDSKTPSFAEDTAVRVVDLPNYVADFKKLLAKYKTTCVFYAHASVGELHLRPVFDLGKSEDIQKMKSMMEDVALLVKSYRGSLSGEHGDGRNRAPYIELMVGAEMMEVLRKVKNIWDPQHIFNPGKIIDAPPMDTHLRHNPFRKISPMDTVFKWRKEKGFHAALELCNGAGVCRKRAESGGTMCPSYMATFEEKDSTRGRANVFRQLFTEKGTDAFSSEEVKEALKLCLSCKACKSECPANVDMAKMKSEFMQGWNDTHGITFASSFWVNPFPFLKLGALFPAISNAVASSEPGKFVMSHFTGLHSERSLPAFAKQSFYKQLNQLKNSGTKDGPEVVMLVDPFTDLHQPHVAVAAWKVLDTLGCVLHNPIIADTGRTKISGGQPALARKNLNALIPVLSSYAKRGVFIIGIEPSELLTLRDEYKDLCTDEQLQSVSLIASKALLIEEFIATFSEKFSPLLEKTGKGKTVYVHGHCYVKALTGMTFLKKALEISGYNPIIMDTGCCGMAGSFGYRDETYELSIKIGNQRLFPQVNKIQLDALLCTHGFSCHHQIKDGTGKYSYHPAELFSGLE
jgi:FAD/FMN-containing dehydrogenase/Fe-S oxidoreductase